MEKLSYWLKKLGVFRTAAYKTKGDASKLNEMKATDGGMIQSQEKIDKEHAEKTGKKISKESEGNKSRVLFWPFLFLALFFLLAFWGGGFSLGSFLALVFWFIFLFYLKKGTASWTSSFVKVLMIGLFLTIMSLIVFDDSPEEKAAEDEKNNLAYREADLVNDSFGGKENYSEEECDDSNSSYASFNEIEKVIVSKNPCKVPWILAKPVENYELKTKKAAVLKVTVFNNYVNNVEPDESYTIRVLDVEEDVTGQKDLKAGVAIVRWVPDKSSLEAAKKEVAETVQNLDY